MSNRCPFGLLVSDISQSVRILNVNRLISSSCFSEKYEAEEKGRLDTSRSLHTEFADDFEPELQNLETSRSVDIPENRTDSEMKVFINERAVSQPNGDIRTVPNDGAPPSQVKQNSSLQINIPQVETVEAAQEKEDKMQKPKCAVTRGRRTPMSSRTPVKTG